MPGEPEVSYSNGLKVYPWGLKYDGVTYYKPNGTISLAYNGNTFISGFQCSGSDGCDVSGSTLTIGFDVEGTATKVSTVASTGNANDPYLIMSANDWNNLVQMVDQGENFSGKFFKLTNNISVDTLVGSDSTDYFFAGTFDGAGNTITVSYGSSDHRLKQPFMAPFRFVNSGTIKNLHTAGSIYIGATKDAYKHAGGIAGRVVGNSLIDNCHSSVTIDTDGNGDRSHGGLVGIIKNGATTISNSYFNGKLLGPYVAGLGGIHGIGGLVGWVESRDGAGPATLTLTNCLFKPAQVNLGTTYYSDFATLARTSGSNLIITNCYYTQTLGAVQGAKVSKNVATNDFNTIVTAADGEVYYASTNATISGISSTYSQGSSTADVVPVIEIGGQVLTNGNDYTFSITKDGNPVGETLSEVGEYTLTVQGEGTTYVGTISTTFQVARILQGDGSADSPYIIANEFDWETLAQQVANGKTFSGDFLKLTNNISVTTMVGTKTDNSGKPFSGTFDGNNKTITISYGSSDSYFTEQYAAPFRYLKSATIKNLNTTGSIFTTINFAAGIAAYVDGNTFIDSCHSNITITSTMEGDASYGGLLSRVEGNPGSATTTITNSHFEGSFIGTSTTNCGGLIGWSHATIVFENCLFNPQNITVSSEGSATFARASSSNNVSTEDCYYTQAFGTAQGVQAYTSTAGHDGLLKKITAVDGNEYYIAMSATVSVNEVYDVGTEVSNVSPVVKIGDQVLENGTNYTFTITKGENLVSGAMSEGEYTVTIQGEGTYAGTISTTFQVVHELQGGDGTADHPYLITSTEDWDIFAQRVNNGIHYHDKYIRLENDITVSTMVGLLDDGENRFHGNFDGAGHTITVDYGTEQNPVGNYAAPFSHATSATIKNLHTSGTIYTNGQYAGGIVGRTTAGDNTTVTIDNCSSDVIINGLKGSADDHGGLVGVVAANSLVIRDSYFNGQLLGNSVKNVGGLVGWIETSATLTNCLFKPAGLSSSARSSGSTLFNARTPANVSISNCYYTEPLNTVQGQFVIATPADGIIYKKAPISAADGENYYLPANVTGIQNVYEFTSPLDISPIVTFNGTTLTKDVDYEVTYNVPGKGEYDIVISGIGDYAGSYSKTVGFFGELEGQGTADNPYTIASYLDWETLVHEVSLGNTFSGEFFRLTDDISVTTMVGSDTIQYFFAGTFDGNSHTIEVSYGSEDNKLTEQNAAPFRFIKNSTIKNLHVTGHIHTLSSRAAGIASVATGNNLIANCWSSVNIHSYFTGSGYTDGSHGGLVGLAWTGSTLTLKDCLFDGSFYGNKTRNIGGFVGFRKDAKEVFVINSLFNPVTIETPKDYSQTFVRDNAVITNCYYTSNQLNGGNNQGTNGINKTATQLVGYLGNAWSVNGEGKPAPAMNFNEVQYGAVTITTNGSTTAYINGSYTGEGSVDIQNDIAVDAVVFNRTFTKGKFSTIVLPFSIAQNKVQGAEFYTISDITKVGDSWKEVEITKLPVDGQIAANTPYLLNPTAETLSFTGGATLNTSNATSPTFGDNNEWTFHGTYNYFVFGDATDIQGKAYGFAAQEQDGYTVGQFAKAGSNAWIPAMRAYLVYNGGNSNAKSALGGSSLAELPETMDVVVVDRNSNGELSKKVIGTVDTRTGEFRMDRWYDMQGRKLNGEPTAKGTYYHNGKAVTIK